MRRASRDGGLAAAGWVVTIVSALVPAHRREVWARQWQAELAHLSARGGSPLRLLLLALGSVRHAIFFRREEATMRGLWADLRHAGRSLARQPGFTALTVATFAIGVGSATAVFSLAEALLLRPLPLEDGERLVRIFSSQARRGLGRFSVSYPDYVDFTGRDDLFDASSFYAERSLDVSGIVEAERARVAEVHRDFFQTLGSPIDLGRAFDGGDHDRGAPRTVIVSESFWRSRLASDSAVVGRTLRLDGVPHTVVGVVRDRFAWPRGVDLWTPLRWGAAVPEYAAPRSNHSWQVVARLRPGVEVDEASSQVRTMARTIYAREDVDPRDEGTEALVVPLHASDAGDDATPLFATLGGAVFFVLMIACMNASGLLLVRAWSRSGELSLRSALGAGRARLVLVMLGESALLALVGGALGVGLGVGGLKHAFAMAPPEITALGELRLNGPVVLIGLGVSLLSALIAGAVPAIRASSVSVAASLKEGGNQASPGRSAAWARKALVVAEVALSLVLLAGAGLTVRGFQRQLATDPGFDPSTLLSFAVRLPESRYGDDALVDAYFREVRERLERHPSIVAASAASRLPLGAGGLGLGRAFGFDGAPPPPDGPSWSAAWIEVDAAWLETLGVRPVEGRELGSGDRADSEPVAMVSERLARQMSPEGSIVGSRIRSVYDENLPRTVVGVIPDLQIRGVSRGLRQPVVLVPRTQSVRRSMTVLVRTSGDPTDLLPVVRETVSEIDADVALAQLGTLKNAHAADLAGIRFLTTVFGAFGLLALLLAVGGVYGLVSFSVSKRRREIGVRVAMGATAAGVRRAVVGESAAMSALGLVLGLPLAYGAGRVLAAGMDGIAILRPSTYVGVVALLAASVLAATWIPAGRATRVDPVEALKGE